MESIKGILDRLQGLEEMENILNSVDSSSSAITLSEICERYQNGQYSRPSQVVDDILFMIDFYRDQFTSDSMGATCLISFENKFRGLMAKKDLSYFLD